MVVNVHCYHGRMTALPLETLAPARTKGCCVSVAPPLPDGEAEDLAALFKALGDRTRVQMLHMLKAAAEPICVCDFTAAFDLGQPTVSHHLARLREAGLIGSYKRGLWTFHHLREDLSDTQRALLALIP